MLERIKVGISGSVVGSQVHRTPHLLLEVSGSGNLAKCFAVKELVMFSKSDCRSSKWVLGPDHSNY